MTFEFVPEDEFEAQISQRLENIRKESRAAGLSNLEWTRKIKLELEDLGTDKGWVVYPNDKRTHKEWVFDMCWVKENCHKTDRNDHSNHIQSLEFVMECEWRPYLSDIRDDFEKLLLAKAPRKLMIFNCKIAEKDKLFEYFKAGVNQFQPALDNERYMLAGYIMGSRMDDHKFEFRSLAHV